MAVVVPTQIGSEIPKSRINVTGTASATSNSTATSAQPATSAKPKHFLPSLTSFGNKFKDKKPGDELRSTGSEASTHGKSDQLDHLDVEDNFSLITRRLTAGARAPVSR